MTLVDPTGHFVASNGKVVGEVVTKQVMKNYRKNTDFYASIRFVVTPGINAQQLREIVSEDPKADPEEYRIDVVEFESPNTIEPKKEEVSAESMEQSESEPLTGKGEEMVLSYVVLDGFTSGEDIADKCSGGGVEISARSV